MTTRLYEPIEEARRWSFVRETLGQNRGVFVEAIQRICDGKPGDSWCCDFLSMVLWICYQGPAPLPRTGSCDAAYQVAKQNGWIVKDPQPNDVFFRVRVVDGVEDAHHVGLVTIAYPPTSPKPGIIGTIAGNTSEDGQSSNGDGVHEHEMHIDPVTMRFVRLPLNTERV